MCDSSDLGTGKVVALNSLHHDEEQFWRDCFGVLDSCANPRQAFCIGLTCCAAALAGGYPSLDVLLGAKEQDTVVFSRMVLHDARHVAKRGRDGKP